MDTVTYRWATLDDAGAIARYLGREFAVQTDLMTRTTGAAGEDEKREEVLRGKLKNPTNIVQLAEEKGEIVGVATGTTGEAWDEGLRRVVKTVTSALVLVSGWKTQHQRLQRLAEFMRWCIAEDMKRGIERIDTLPLHHLCMGSKWMENTVGCQNTEVVGEQRVHKMDAKKMLDRLTVSTN